MRALLAISRAIALLALLASAADARAEISDEARRDLAEIVASPVPVVEVDAEAYARELERIDGWVAGHLEIDDAARTGDEPGDRRISVAKAKQNRAIFSDGRQGDGVAPPQPFEIRYVREPWKRLFSKDLETPTRARLEEPELERMAREFVERNGFSASSEVDRIDGALFTARMRQQLGELASSEAGRGWTLFQRVQLERRVFGLPVMNSRQFVDFHPDSGEVVGYRRMWWAPVDPASQRSLPYRSVERLLEELGAALGEGEGAGSIARVEAGMYQTDRLVFPVLAAYVDAATGEDQWVAIERVIVVSLVDGLEFERVPPPRRRPEGGDGG